jgi:hypothetical protein
MKISCGKITTFFIENSLGEKIPNLSIHYGKNPYFIDLEAIDFFTTFENTNPKIFTLDTLSGELIFEFVSENKLGIFCNLKKESD